MKQDETDQDISLYAEAMAEVRTRLTVIESAINKETHLPQAIARELCYLQLRMICELIALGCLIAHGDLRDGRLTKEYAADKIIARLASLHPRFYPQPIELTGNQVRDRNVDHLTRERLQQLYARCGGELHKGNLKRVLGERRSIRGWVEEMKVEAQLIANLLGSHAIVFSGDTGAIFCNLASGQVMRAVALN